jgi:hypothetical protein
MAGRRPMPEFFDIDDTVPNRPSSVPALADREPQPEEGQT